MTEKLWTADELCRHLFPSTFLIEPFLPRGGIALMYGKRGIGKTHFALTLATCLTEGGVLFGRYRTRKGPVVYVQADMGAAITQERVRKAKSLYTLDHLYFTFQDFLNVPHLGPDDDFVRTVASVQPELIIWDTLRQIHRMDMNSDETPAWIYGNARHLFPGSTHLFIHHDKKTIADQDKLDNDESFRGSGAWIDNADAGLKLRELGLNRVGVEFTKVRTCPPQASLALSLSLDTMLLYASSDPSDLIARWRQRHPLGTRDELDRFLLNSFAVSPRTLRTLHTVGRGALTGAGEGVGGGGTIASTTEVASGV